ncbi:MAG: hypothetical protein HY060_11615 [Proteobacteria bacterium]|nr:hypothetical protein [Pseudomonadota bacterium]
MSAATRWLGLLLFIATVGLMLYLARQGADLVTAAAPQGIVSLELAWHSNIADPIIKSWNVSQDCQAIVQVWNVPNNCRAIVQVWIDVPFIAAYASLLFWLGRTAATRVEPTDPGLARRARRAAVLGLLAGALDIIEDIGLLLMLNNMGGSILPTATSIAATAKFVLILWSLWVSLYGHAKELKRADGGGIASWASLLRTARAATGLLVLTAIALALPPQTADMLAEFSWGGPGLWSAITFHLTLLLVALCAWHWSRAVLSARAGVGDDRAARAALATRGVHEPRPIDDSAFARVPHLLFWAVGAIGVIAALRSHAWVTLAIVAVWTWAGARLLHHRLTLQEKYLKRADLTRSRGPKTPVPGWLPVLLRGLWRTHDALIRHAPLGAGFARFLLGVAAIAFLFGVVETLILEDMSVSQWLGYWLPGPAAALFAIALAIGPLTVLSYAADRVRLGGTLFGIAWQLRRPPLFLALVLVVILTPTLVPLHGVRLVGKPVMQPNDRKLLEHVFAEWAANCLPNKDGPVRPIIVAVSGGASRAGLWGAGVLAAVDRIAADHGTAVFAISSVSGGSLGAAAYLATLAGQDDKASPPGKGCRLAAAAKEEQERAFIQIGRRDALGPALSGALFGDVPRALFGIPAYFVRRALNLDEVRGGDRAEALERAFEKNWSAIIAEGGEGSWKAGRPLGLSQPFLALGGATGRGPVWIANGTDAQNGGRVLTIPFRVATAGDWQFPGGRDLLHLLQADVAISTAINNTSRFPFLSPSGELAPKSGSSLKFPTQVIDGGYFENEGLQTALDLARWLGRPRALGDRRVEPIVVQATADAETDPLVLRCDSPPDDPGESRGQTRPVQALVPLIGVYAVRGGHTQVALQDAVSRYCPKRAFFHLYLYSDADNDVPLNWVLSEEIAGYIWGLTKKRPENLKELDALRGALAQP